MLFLNGCMLLLALLGNAVPDSEIHAGGFHIALRWMTRGYELLQNAILVVLLFWLARYRMKLHPAT
jgi:hypothetical protein